MFQSLAGNARREENFARRYLEKSREMFLLKDFTSNLVSNTS